MDITSGGQGLGVAVFCLTLLATFVLAALGRRHGPEVEGGLAEHRLNRWLIGLSAGAAANSGFVVTGAVALGYTAGLQWLLLPLGWLIGDIVFWRFFPARLNEFGRRSQATTLSELLTHGSAGRTTRLLGMLCAIVVLTCLSGYVAAQWLAGQRFVTGAFAIPDLGALTLFAVIIIAYTAIGGFRGSVYVDSFQAVVRLLGTTLAIAAVAWFALAAPGEFSRNLEAAGPGFLSFSPVAGLPAIVGMLAGFGAAALGFGLGQPHLVSRYLAGASPAETQAAWWIYIFFVQYTWVSMTVFGMLLRGVMPGVAEPEAGLSTFFSSHMGAIATGIIVADVFATIAATSNSLLVAMAQTLSHDLLPRVAGRPTLPVAAGCLLFGALTMGLSLVLDTSVVSLALGSVSLMAASIAPPVMIRVLGWRSTPVSLLASLAAGLAAALAWKASGLAVHVNEAAPGITAGLAVHFLVLSLTPRAELRPTGSPT